MPIEKQVRFPERRGQFYWCIKVPKNICPKGEIYAYADHIYVHDGVLILEHKWEEEYQINIAFRDWLCFFAASVMDGHAIAVEHWEGEVLPSCVREEF